MLRKTIKLVKKAYGKSINLPAYIRIGALSIALLVTVITFATICKFFKDNIYPETNNASEKQKQLQEIEELTKETQRQVEEIKALLAQGGNSIDPIVRKKALDFLKKIESKTKQPPSKF